MDRLGKGDNKWSPDSFATYYGLLAKAGEDDKSEFIGTDLNQYFGKIPDQQLVQLAQLQRTVSAKDAQTQARDVNLRAAHGAVKEMWAPVVAGKPKERAAALGEQFFGRLDSAIDQVHASTNHWPTQIETQKIAAGLLAQGAQRNGWLFWPDSKTRFFQSEDPSTFYVPLPDAKTPAYANLAQQFQSVMGRKPQGAELQDWYTKYKLAGGK